jgi:hypothetical protein
MFQNGNISVIVVVLVQVEWKLMMWGFRVAEWNYVAKPTSGIIRIWNRWKIRRKDESLRNGIHEHEKGKKMSEGMETYIKNTLSVDERLRMDDDVKLEKCIELIGNRISERQSVQRNDWENGYSQAMIDVFNLLNGIEIWCE